MTPSVAQLDFCALIVLACEPDHRDETVDDIACAFGETMNTLDPRRFVADEVAAHVAGKLHERLRQIHQTEGHA